MSWLSDPIRMIRDIRGLGGFIRIWGGALNMPQIVGGLLFIFTIEGRVVVFTCLLTLIIAGQIHRREPFSRLTGICHLPWLIMVPWLLGRMQAVDHGMIMTLWLGYVVITSLISLAFDARDLWRYSRGDRVFAWASKGKE